MPYTRPYAAGFVDFPLTSTPINSTALNTMDVGIKTSNDQFQSVTTTERTAITSPIVGQCVWDSTLRQLMVYMNATTGNAWQPIGNSIVCASTTRPVTPFEGQVIRETDTNKELTYSGAAWVETNGWNTTTGVTGVNNLIVPPACHAYHNTTQSITTSAVPQAVVFNSEVYDTDAMHNTSTNTSRITINTTGLYSIAANLTWANTSAVGVRTVWIYIDGAGPATQNIHQKRSASSDGAASNDRMNVSGIMSLTAGQYIEVYVEQTSGGALSLVGEASRSGCNFSAVWMGRAS